MSAPRPIFISKADDDIVRAAIAKCKRNPETNGVDNKELIDKIESLIAFDPVKERRKKAIRLFRKRTKPNNSEPDGQLWIPGLEKPYAYEPNRLILDGQGHAVEQDKATFPFKSAHFDRTEANFVKQQAIYFRDRRELEMFGEWVRDEIIKGRPPSETTLGNFVRETGFWTPASDMSEPDDDDDEDEE